MCEKTDVEREAVLYIQTIVEDRQMPLVVVDVEFQFDRHKLVVYFESVTYVHFHHLVREIYKVTNRGKLKHKTQASTTLTPWACSYQSGV